MQFENIDEAVMGICEDIAINKNNRFYERDYCVNGKTIKYYRDERRTGEYINMLSCEDERGERKTACWPFGSERDIRVAVEYAVKGCNKYGIRRAWSLSLSYEFDRAEKEKRTWTPKDFSKTFYKTYCKCIVFDPNPETGIREVFLLDLGEVIYFDRNNEWLPKGETEDRKDYGAHHYFPVKMMVNEDWVLSDEPEDHDRCKIKLAKGVLNACNENLKRIGNARALLDSVTWDWSGVCC